MAHVEEKDTEPLVSSGENKKKASFHNFKEGDNVEDLFSEIEQDCKFFLV